MRTRLLTAVVLAATLAAVPGAEARPRALRAFGSCTALLDYARTHAARAVGTGWVPSPMTLEGPRPISVSGKGTSTPQQSAAEGDSAAGPTAGTDYSGTNVQEAGVDEPDVVKTDGKTLFAVANGVLHAIDTSAATPTLIDTVTLDPGYGHELLLHGDRLLVIQNAWLETNADGSARQAPGAGKGIAAPAFGRPVTRLTEIDVSDPAAMRVVRHERDDGEYVSARMTGDAVRIVLASRAPIMFAVARASAPSERRLVGKRRRQVRRAQARGLAPAHVLPLGPAPEARTVPHAHALRRRPPHAAVLGPRHRHDPHRRPGQGPAVGRRRGDHERRADRLRIARPALRRDPALARAAAHRAGPGADHDDRDPRVRHLVAGPHALRRHRDGRRASCSTSSRCPSTRASCAWRAPRRPSGGARAATPARAAP